MLTPLFSSHFLLRRLYNGFNQNKLSDWVCFLRVSFKNLSGKFQGNVLWIYPQNVQVVAVITSLLDDEGTEYDEESSGDDDESWTTMSTIDEENPEDSNHEDQWQTDLDNGSHGAIIFKVDSRSRRRRYKQ